MGFATLRHLIVVEQEGRGTRLDKKQKRFRDNAPLRQGGTGVKGNGSRQRNRMLRNAAPQQTGSRHAAPLKHNGTVGIWNNSTEASKGARGFATLRRSRNSFATLRHFGIVAQDSNGTRTDQEHNRFHSKSMQTEE